MFPGKRRKQKGFILLATLGVLILLSLITAYVLQASVQSNALLIRSIDRFRLKQAALSVVELKHAGLQACDPKPFESYLPKDIVIEMECVQGLIKVRAMTVGTTKAYYEVESKGVTKNMNPPL